MRTWHSLFLFSALLCAPIPSALRSQDSRQRAPAAPAPTDGLPARPGKARELSWHDITAWGVEGREWIGMDRLRWFDRLPAAAEKTVTTAVWNLSRDSSGMMVRFKTDARETDVHYRLRSDRLSLPVAVEPGTGTTYPAARLGMAAVAVSGVDLYARDPEGKWRWVSIARPATQEVNAGDRPKPCSGPP